MSGAIPTAKDLAELGLPVSLAKKAPLSKGGESTSIQLGNGRKSDMVSDSSSQVPPSKYAGDYELSTEEAVPLQVDGYTVCDLFTSPAHLITSLIPSFNTFKTQLHTWQKEQNQELADSFKWATDLQPYKLALCAANGSGKDYLVIAPLVIWACLTQIRCLTIITSSSGTQLTAQTENYIRALAHKVNERFGELYGGKVFHIRQRYIRCNLTGAEVRMFATDEAGKAEGYHPLEPGAKMLIIVNEAKSVEEQIFEALTRCTGFSHWLNVSTPGEPKGSFYDSFCNWDRTRHVTTYDCPHLSEVQRQDDRRKYGEHSALYRSKHLALFTTLGGTYVIAEEILTCLLDEPPDLELEEKIDGIGLDLAAGGDENCITRTKGCKVVSEYAFHERDTTKTADMIEEHFLKVLRITKDFDNINADDGGVGHAIIDMLVRRGWKINRVLNQSPAINKSRFGNRGAEMWYNLLRILEEKTMNISGLSPLTITQLSHRQYKQSEAQGRIFLESKKEAKAHGRPSPDRADAFVLSLTGRTIDDFIKATPVVKKAPTNVKQIVDSREFQDWYAENVVYANHNAEYAAKVKGDGKRIYGSLRRAMLQNN